ncbi:hypothetical protein [Pseudomonas duriflava]|nr:hypothetical protein [Pseudomonas duriflava]
MISVFTVVTLLSRLFCKRNAHCVVLLVLATGSLAGCSGQFDHASIMTKHSPVEPGEFFQTNVDRMATLAMRDNLNSLYRLLSKLYRRNPAEWRKTGLPDVESAERAIQASIEQNRDLPSLNGVRDIQALSYALSPEFQGDRVGAFIYAIGTMLITAHGGRMEFYITDTLNAEFIHNAARNIEKATWMLGHRKGLSGQRLLLANELSGGRRNLSFAVEFGKIVARLDLLSEVLDERYRRLGVSYAQSLLFMNFLPVQ